VVKPDLVWVFSAFNFCFYGDYIVESLNYNMWNFFISWKDH
jgi:hypothetical protein